MTVGLCQGTSFQPMSSARINIIFGCFFCPTTNWDKQQRAMPRFFIAVMGDYFYLDNIISLNPLYSTLMY